MEWTRFICNRSDTLTTHVSTTKMLLDNTYLKENNYILSILDSSWLSPVKIESMGENFGSVKVDQSIFNRKTSVGLKRVEHPRFY